jgi:hypothetical protein
MLHYKNVVQISRAEFNRIKNWDTDKMIAYLIEIYGDAIKNAIVEGFVFKIDE